MRVVLCTVLLQAFQPAEAIRGVPPQDIALYEGGGGGSLQCPPPDRPRKLHAAEINDDYCDCPLTGFDEPGTGACSVGRFYCQNRDWRPAFIPSIHVDDGHCDCCDGSDESKLKCPDSCAAQRTASIKSRRKKRRYYQQAVGERSRYALLAALHLTQARKTQEALRQLVYEKESQLAQVEGKKSELCQPKGAHASLENCGGCRQIAERISQLEAMLEALVKTPKDRSTLAKYRRYREEHMAPEQGEWKCDIPFQGDSTNADGSASEQQTKASKSTGGTSFLPFSVWGLENLLYGLSELALIVKSTTTQSTTTVTKYLFSQPTMVPPPGEVQSLQDLARELQNRIREHKDELEAVDTVLRGDYGDDDVYFALSGQCYASFIDQKSYQICPYHNITVQEDSSRSIVLGYWNGWDSGRMLFNQGTYCWQGPLRSAVVSPVCGPENKITYVSEREVCRFTVKFSTPAACSPITMSNQEDADQQGDSDRDHNDGSADGQEKDEL